MRIFKQIFIIFWETIKIVAIALMIVLPIRAYVFQPFFIRGSSMEPDFHNNDYLIVDEISYKFTNPKRGDVIVFKYPNNPSQRYIKRIIGLPGETIKIKDGHILITHGSEIFTLDERSYSVPNVKTLGNQQVDIDSDSYFVLGDNRKPSASYDSRSWGLLPKENIIGKAVLRLWPVEASAKIVEPEY